MDQYMGAAYKTREAREKARGHSKRGFLAPGFPVEAPPAPPPVPPGVALAPAAAPAAGVFSVAGGLGVLTGLGLGLSVKADIDRFKAKAKRPWYDTDYIPGYGKGLKVNPLFDRLATLSDYQLSQLVDYDFEADYLHWWHLQEIADNYEVRKFENPWLYDLGGDLPNGWRYTGPGTLTVGYCSEPTLSCNINGFHRFAPIGNTLPQWGSPASQCPPDCSGTTFYDNNVTGFPSPWEAYAAYPVQQPITVGFYFNAASDPAFKKAIGSCARNAVVTYARASNPDNWVQERRAIALEAQPLYPRPWRERVAPPGTQPALQPAVRPYVVPQVLDLPLQELVVGVGSGPVSVPDVVVISDPGVEPTIGVSPPTGPITPTPPGDPMEHEAKPWKRVAGIAFSTVNFVTEAIDLIDSVHQAIPRGLRGSTVGGPTVNEKLWEIWANLDEVDWTLALENFINNRIEDYVIGQQSRLVQRAGGRITGRRHSRYISRAGVLGRETAVSLPVPQVHFANGTHEIVIGEMTIGQSDGSTPYFEREVF